MTTTIKRRDKRNLINFASHYSNRGSALTNGTENRQCMLESSALATGEINRSENEMEIDKRSLTTDLFQEQSSGNLSNVWHCGKLLHIIRQGNEISTDTFDFISVF